MTLAFLKPREKKNRKRKGRGNASGLGGECGRGHKGQKSRSGFKRKPGFEGGQTPLYRRLPKKNGFNNNRFKKKYDIINLNDLEIFDNGETVTVELLKNKKLVSGKNKVKLLSYGTLTKKLTIQVNAYSKTAVKIISKLQGNIVEIN